ncbi:hypothetical protein HNY73_003825 [Argiope bruennichi]|uniref:Uncharacterized protein n=1 Tax=Argiope bruennichi TaxID=94029 RepID=A0A8T0FMQ6_ARGBR|nr:hypothetical protein HNY73_003825 [Argiope bruennichi]
MLIRQRRREAVLYQEAVYVTSPTSCKGDVSNHLRFESPCSGGVARNRMARDYLQPFSPYGRYYLKVTAQLGSSRLLRKEDTSADRRPFIFSKLCDENKRPFTVRDRKGKLYISSEIKANIFGWKE